MKFVFLLVFMSLISGCAYNYHLGVAESAAVETFTTVKFSNRIKVSSIDGEEFSPKFSIWVDGSHTLRLPPGMHSFVFVYNAVSQNGGYYTKDPVEISRYFLAGETYEIKYKFEGGKILFEIVLSNT